MTSDAIHYRRPVLEVSYDFVWIVDGLPPNETKRYGLTRALGDQIRKAGVSFNLNYCTSEPALFRALEQMSTASESGASFPIHFICHGNKTGLAMGADLVTWSDLRPHLNHINSQMSGNLVLNVTSCFGLFGLNTIAADASLYPFFGLFGSNRKIGIREAAEINTRFYNLWLAGKDLGHIVKIINNERGSEVLFCGSTEGIVALRSRKGCRP